MRKWIIRGIAVLALLWVFACAGVYWLMRKPPEEFAMAFGKLPLPAMMVIPFQTLWNQARGGELDPGEPAPDFALEKLDKSGTVRLSEHRGVRPVLLVFGSYT